MRLLRKVFFYIFLGIYLIVCPWIVFRMLGFVIEGNPPKLIKTGLIYAATNPPGAEVIIDGRKAKEKTPTVIRDLRPGNHRVELTIPNYKPWQQEVSVTGKKATVLENILLYPAQWQTKPITQMPLQALIAISGNPYLLVSAGDTIEDLYLLPLNKDIEQDKQEEAAQSTSTPKPLFPSESIYGQEKIVRFFHIEQSPFFILQITNGETNKYLWVDPRDKPLHIEDITDLLPQTPKAIFWDASDDTNIFILKDNFLNRINIKAKAIYPRILNNIHTAAIAGNTLIALTEDFKVIRSDLDGGNKKEMEITLPPTFRQAQWFSLSPIDEKLVVLNSNEGFAFINSAAHPLSSQALGGTRIDKEHSTLLIWNNEHIGYIDYSKRDYEDYVKPTIISLHTKGRQIEQAFWANNGTVVIFRDGDTVYLLDKNALSSSSRRLQKVIKVKKGADVYFLESTGKLYYIDPQTNLLSSVRILHHKAILPLPIADTLIRKF